jgi:hypothetical protein
VKLKPGELRAKWSRRERDVEADASGAGRADIYLILDALCGKRFSPSPKVIGAYQVDPSLRDELERRGYDITTLKFSIQKRAPSNGQ